MRFLMNFLIAAILFAAAPSYGVRAQELIVDTNSSAGNTRSPAKKGGGKQGAKENGIHPSPPADLSFDKEPKEFDWTGLMPAFMAGRLAPLAGAILEAETKDRQDDSMTKIGRCLNSLRKLL
jgi:hypothetical protein